MTHLVASVGVLNGSGSSDCCSSRRQSAVKEQKQRNEREGSEEKVA